MKRYIRAAEINIGPYTYKSEHYLKKAAKNSTDSEELRAIYNSKPNTWVKEALAYNENTPADILAALADNIKSGRVGVGLAFNPSTPKDTLKSLFYTVIESGNIMYDYIIATKIIRIPEFSRDTEMRHMYIDTWPSLVCRVDLFSSGFQRLEGVDPIFLNDINDANFMLDSMQDWPENSLLWIDYSKYVSNPLILDKIIECDKVFAVINVLNNPHTSGSSIRKFLNDFLDKLIADNPEYFDKVLDAIENNPNTPEDILEDIANR